MILVLTEIQQRIGKHAGDRVQVTIALDTAARVVELDDDGRDALAEAGQLDHFRALSYSHQREYWLRISAAKRVETRQRRVQEAIEMIAAGQRLT